MLEPAAAAQINGDADDKGDAGDCESHVVSGGELVDVVLAEGGEVHARNVCTGHGGLEGLESGRIGEGAAEVLVGEGGDVGLIDEAGLCQMAVGQCGGCCGSEHGADVYGHVEEAECGVALGGVLGVVVEIADQDLQVALEQAGTHRYEQQGADHQCKGQAAARKGVGRNGQAQVADEHYADAGDYTFAETDLVCKPAAYYRHKVNCREEDCIELACGSGGEAELSLQEEQEDGQHGVVAKALACICKGEGEEAFGLSFKHVGCRLII